MQDFMFSDGQDLGSLNSTGVVSTNVYDMELTASGGATIIENDQVDAYLNVKILATTNTGGDEGLDIQLRASDNANMSTTPEYLGALKLLKAEIVAGKRFSIRVIKTLSNKFLGVWFKAASTSLNLATTVDVWLSDTPISENEDVQKTSQQH